MPQASRWLRYLSSPLHGALVQSVEVFHGAIRGDVAAARVDLRQPALRESYVAAQRLLLPQDQEAELMHWPTHPDSIFRHLIRHNSDQPVWRLPCREKHWPDRVFHKCTGNSRRIHDGLAVKLDLSAYGQAMILLMRCKESPALKRRQVQLAEKMVPALTKLFTQAIHQWHAQPTHAGRAAPLPADRPLSHRLSRTERIVLSYLLTKMTERQIAVELQRSPHTVHVHVKNIYRKLNVSSRRQLQGRFRGE